MTQHQDDTYQGANGARLLVEPAQGAAGPAIRIRAAEGVEVPLADIGDFLDFIRTQAGSARGAEPLPRPEFERDPILSEHVVVDYEGGPEGQAPIVAVCACGQRSRPHTLLDDADEDLANHLPETYQVALNAQYRHLRRVLRTCGTCGSYGDWEETVTPGFGPVPPDRVWVCAVHGVI